MLQFLVAISVLSRQISGFFIHQSLFKPHIFLGPSETSCSLAGTFDGPCYIPDSSREVERFVHTLVVVEECEGIEATAIGYRHADRRRGVFSKECFAPGEYILAIPFTSVLLVHETIAGEEEPSDIQLGFCFWNKFLQGYDEDNCDEIVKDRWKFYLDCLPKRNSSQFTPTPEFWTDEAINAIEVPMLIQEMRRRQQDINNTVQKHFPNVSSDMRRTLSNDLRFASWLVRSRGFTTVKVNPLSAAKTDTIARSRTVLIPYMDFINHESEDTRVNAEIQVVHAKSDDESFFALVATRSIEIGDEILIQYGTGQETTLDLLSKYGFYTSDWKNMHDESFFRCSFNGTGIWTTSIHDDEQVLQTQVLSDDMRNAMELRLHLKRIEERTTNCL